MKIAYCFSGHLRTFKFNESLLRHLIGKNPGDVFVHTFPVYNVRKEIMWHNDSVGHDALVTEDDWSTLRRMYDITDMAIDTKTCGADHLAPDHAKMGFRWSHCRSHEIRAEHEKRTGKRYDLVFDARFDLVLDEPFAFPESPLPNTFYGSYNLSSISKGIDGEVFSYGTPEVMNKIMVPAIPSGEIADRIASFDFEGERLVTEIRKSHGIEYAAHRVPCYLMRSNGTLLRIQI